MSRSTAPSANHSGQLSVPAITLRSAEGARALVPVSIDRHRYLFVVDTGASTTVISQSVARALKLPRAGKTVTFSPLGCRVSSEAVDLTHWRLGGIALPAMTVYTQPLTAHLGGGGRLPVIGLIGAATLSRFGSVSIDFRTRRLILRARGVTGGHTIPIGLLRLGGHGPLVTIKATIGDAARTYLLDTGSGLPLILRQALPALGLRASPRTVTLHGATGCPLPARQIRIASWSSHQLALPTTPALSARSLASAVLPGDLSGIIGLGPLAHFGVVTINFKHKRLVLGGTVR